MRTLRSTTAGGTASPDLKRSTLHPLQSPSPQSGTFTVLTVPSGLTASATGGRGVHSDARRPAKAPEVQTLACCSILQLGCGRVGLHVQLPRRTTREEVSAAALNRARMRASVTVGGGKGEEELRLRGGANEGRMHSFM